MSSVTLDDASQVLMRKGYTPQMIQDLGQFNEAWKIVHEIDSEWEQGSVMDFLLHEYFNNRYHKFTELKQNIDVGNPERAVLCGSVVCGRCGLDIKVEHRNCANGLWNRYSVGLVGDHPFLSFSISKTYISDVSITRNYIPYCKKFEAFL